MLLLAGVLWEIITIYAVRGASDQLIIVTSTALVNCLIMMIGSVKVASTDIHEAMLRELTAGNMQTRNYAAQYQTLEGGYGEN